MTHTSTPKPRRGETPRRWLTVCLVGLAAAVVYAFLPVEETARRTAAIFTLAALFWALEIIPIYATSLLVIVLEIFLLSLPGGASGSPVIPYKTFLEPFASPVIILFFGGFTLARAVARYGIDRLIARRLLGLLGHHPFRLMAGLMGATALLSMWMSNTATAAMMMAMIQPVFLQMDKDDPFRRGLVLSIPFAANIGGMGTPVGSPPNAIAIGILAGQGIQINFLSWMLMAIPLVVVLLLVTAVLIYRLFPPRTDHISLEVESGGPLAPRARWVAVIGGVTILLWLTSGVTRLPSAVVALLAATLFAVTGLLDREDFKSLDWDILLLMWGGLALGKGLDVSGLTDWIVSLPVLNQEGLLLVVMAGVLAVLISTFISNTATANLLIPIVIGLPGQSPLVLAIVVGLSCSLAMALPVSTPPNAIAFASQMVRGRDMLKTGSLVSAMALLILLAGIRWLIAAVYGAP
jgi:sodium-dependent dicarboxylate transporter 2/3/5